MHYISRILSSRGWRFTISKNFSSPITTLHQPFKYAPLDVKSNEIRLLTVLPADGSQELNCSLTHASLDQLSEYHALSYAWRDDDLLSSSDGKSALDESSEEITINNARLRVGRNLAAALKARRSHGYRAIPIWVDAISINQNEIAERSGQILRMRDIYARASKVTVWLGPERDDSTTAFRFIEMIHNRSKGFEQSVKDPVSGDMIKDSGFANWFEKSLVRKSYSQEWRAVHSLLRRAWWKRIWIVQEMVAARNVVLFCGERTLDPVHLSAFFDLLVTHGIMYLPLLSKVEGIVLEYDSFSLARGYLKQDSWKNLSLLQALYRTGMSLSSEPRDKVYAVLNLAQDGDKLVPRPDYSLSIRNIYKQLVISMAEQTKRLDFLSLAGLPVYPRKVDANLPTWTPDWTYRVTSTINSSVGDVKSVWADRQSKAVASFHSESNILIAKGFIFDTVDGLAQDIGGLDSHNPHYKMQQSTSRSNPYSGWGTVDAIWRALIADLIYSRHRQSHEALSLFLRRCRSPQKHIPIENCYTFANWYQYNKDLIVAGRSIEEWGNDPKIPWTDDGLEEEGSESDLFHYRLASHWTSRRFITSMKGYAGLGTMNCAPGDKICIILGCSTPIILRNVDSHFEVVGECYLHGIMHGEAMIDLDAGKYELQDLGIW